MTRLEMLKLYGKGRRRNPRRAFEAAIKKWSELPSHVDELMDKGDASPHWPCAANCAMCYHAGVGLEGLDCNESDCIIKAKGLCGEDADIYEDAVRSLRSSNILGFEERCQTMTRLLCLEYIKYLTKRKGIIK